MSDFGSGFSQGMRAMDDMFATIASNKVREEQATILRRERESQEALGARYREATGGGYTADGSGGEAAGGPVRPAAIEGGGNPFAGTGQVDSQRATGAGGGFGAAIEGFYNWVRGESGEREAVPGQATEQRRQQKLTDMRSVNVSQVEQGVRRAAQIPDGQPTPGLAWDKLNDMMTDHFMSRGDVPGLTKAQAYMETARAKGLALTLNQAVATAQTGNMQGAALLLNRANSFMPDGNAYQATPVEGGVQMTVTNERSGQSQSVVLGPAQIEQYAQNLMDPEKQRQHILNLRKQDEIERNGRSSRGLAGIQGRVALSANARAEEDQSFQRSDRAAGGAYSAATANLERLLADPNAKPEDVAAARAAVIDSRGKLQLPQRGQAINVDVAETGLRNSQEDRAAGQGYVQAVSEAQTLLQQAEQIPTNDPRRADADRAADAAVSKVSERFGQLNLSQASTAQQLETRMDALNVSRNDRAQLGRFVQAASAVSEAEGEVRAAAATGNPQALATAQTKLGEAQATARRAMAGMSPSAVTKLDKLVDNNLLPRMGGAGASRTPRVTISQSERDKVAETVPEVLEQYPEASRGRLDTPQNRAMATDLAVALAQESPMAAQQAANVAWGILDNKLPVSASGVVTLPSGGRAVLPAEITEAVLKAREAAAAEAQKPGFAARVGGAVGRSAIENPLTQGLMLGPAIVSGLVNPSQRRPAIPESQKQGGR